MSSKNSLRTPLFGLWLLILAIALTLGFLIWRLFDQGVGAQVAEGNRKLDRALKESERRFERYRRTFGESPLPLEAAQTRADLELLLTAVLGAHPGVEGGLMDATDRSLAYAFPTHEGADAKRDVPAAELSEIRATVQKARAGSGIVRQRMDARSSSLLLAAHRLPDSDLTLWMMTRVPLEVGKSYQRLALGLGMLLLLVLGSGIWLLRSFRRWVQRIVQLEQSLGATPVDGLPQLAETGERELDRLIAAVNRLNVRLAEAQRSALRLSTELAKQERLASLGRMSAGLAHEIGNPLAVMRLRAENARAGSPERASAALETILAQVGRLEDLLQRLKLLTRLSNLSPDHVQLRPWLQSRLETLAPQAEAQEISLSLTEMDPEARWTFDEASLGRALDNLIINALQHSPRGGTVRVSASLEDRSECVFRVADEGAGVDPAEAERIFEPFVSRRPEGSGLGLSIVREIAQSHGGSASCLPRNAVGGATFEIRLPLWPAS